MNFTIFGGANQKYHDQMKEWMDISIEEGIKFFLTSLGKPHEIVKIAKKNGIKVYHDVPNKKVALAMIDCGVDGLNCINWRAGGQTGIQSAEKFIEELNEEDNFEKSESTHSESICTAESDDVIKHKTKNSVL